MLIVFGSWRLGIVSMIPNVYPVGITFGVMGLFGIPLDTDTLLIAPMRIDIAVDDTIHFVTHYRASLVECGSIRSAIRGTIEEVGQAISFTSVILILGFLIGTAFATAPLADLFLLPALLSLTGADFGRARAEPAR